jgi:DNA replication and repair protein RecF
MIRDIRLQHFRSYTDAQFDFKPGVTIVAGPNASGKTNLLEALLVVAHGNSFKAKDNELVQHDSDWMRLDAHTDNGGARIVKLKNQPLPQKTFEIDEQTVTRLHQSKTLPVVLFEPNHLLLLSGSPDLRRSFLDDLIEQSESGYANIRRHYKRVLSQRNALLKKNPYDLKEQLFVWNVRLSELAGQVAKQRYTLVQRFNELIPDLYVQLSGRNNIIRLEYASRFNIESYESQLLHKLEQNPDLEALRGFTAYGPHRDDLGMYMDGRTIQETASRGETRTLVLALKIVELQLLEQARQTKPIVLLDDVFSELDTERRHALTKYIRDYQSFITTTDADVLTEYFSAATGSIIKTAKD